MKSEQTVFSLKNWQYLVPDKLTCQHHIKIPQLKRNNKMLIFVVMSCNVLPTAPLYTFHGGR